jgi:hypothetical protein
MLSPPCSLAVYKYRNHEFCLRDMVVFGWRSAYGIASSEIERVNVAENHEQILHIAHCPLDLEGPTMKLPGPA